MLERNIRRRVERAFYDYTINSKKAAAYIDSYYTGITANWEGLRSSGGQISNPTEKKALRALEGAEREAIAWCKVVEQTLDHFARTGKDELIRLRYFQNVSEYKICYEKLYISRRSLFDWIEDIINYASLIAMQLQLIKII